MSRAICIVLDSAGVAPMPDQAKYGDVGACTIPNIAKASNGINLPNMQKLGLGNLNDIVGCPKEKNTNDRYLMNVHIILPSLLMIICLLS